jgi:hypothetical protein
MIKNCIASICLLFSIIAFAQDGSPSPYSFYGIGDIRFKGAFENRAMGSVSVFKDSIHINLQNPASLANLKLTTFSMATSTSETTLITNTNRELAKRSAIDYVMVAFPIGDFGTTVGLLPYSSVGYKINANTTGVNFREFSGTGGMNKFFVGVGYKLNKEFNVGLKLDYNFGRISTLNIFTQNGIQFATKETNVSNMSGVNFNLGLMYASKLKNKLDIFGSMTFQPESKLKITNNRNISTVFFSPVQGEVPQDSQNIAVEDKFINLPARFSFGGGIGKARKWQLGSEIVFQQTNNFSNRFNDIDNVRYQNGFLYSLGGSYVPKFNSFKSYLSRITYRGGMRFENTGLVIANKTITDTALTLGFGLPVGPRFSNINVGVEFGKRGTKAANLVEEQYINFTLSLSLSDVWFVRSKYN